MNMRQNIIARLVSAALVSAMAIVLSGCATTTKPARTSQLYHIGLVWLKEPGNAEHRQKIIEAAHSFARDIPEVQSIAVGKTLPKTSTYTDASFDVCVVMQFKDLAAMQRYGQHPTHTQAAHEAFLPLSQKIVFYDFISE